MSKWKDIWYFLVNGTCTVMAGYMIWTGEMLSPARMGGLVMGLLFLISRNRRDLADKEAES